MPKYLFNVYGSVEVEPDDLVLLTTSIPNAIDDQLYDVQFQAAGGTPPYTWSLIAPADTTPPGLPFGPDGLFRGTPTTPGTYPLNFRVTDNLGQTANTGVINFQVSAVTSFTVTTTSLPPITRGETYNYQVQSAGGTGTVTYGLVAPNNVWPTGLSMSPSGLITGVPTVVGSTQVKIRATDSMGVADSGLLTITINQVAALSITTPAVLPPATQSVAYNRTFATAGGWGDVDWTVLSGSTPTGMTFSNENGTLTGPSATIADYVFTLRATDSEGRTADRTFSLQVRAAGGEAFMDFFNEQDARPEKLFSYSLRDQAQVNARMSAPAGIPMRTWTYNPGADTYHTPKDAVRLTMNHSLSDNQLDFPLNSFNINSGKLLIIYDFWWGPEFKTSLEVEGADLQHKFTQMRDQGGKFKDQSIYIEQQALYRPTMTAPEIARAQLRTYENGAFGTEWGVISTEEYNPTGVGAVPTASHIQRYGVWIRNWLQYELRVPGTDFTDFLTDTGSTSPYPYGTRNVIGSATDGAGACIVEVEPYTYLKGTPPNQVTRNGWEFYDTQNLTGNKVTIITIAGHSNPALNGTHSGNVIDPSHIKIPVNVGGTTGTGGTCSKNYIRFTWIQAEEDREPFYLYNRVPVELRSSGKLVAFDYEMNTSKPITVLKGWLMSVQPSIASPTELTTPVPHGLSTGDFVWISSASTIPQAAYNITVTGPNTMTIPVNVTGPTTLIPPAQPQIQRLNFGDIGPGDSFTLRWDGATAPTPIVYSADMSADIFNALDVLAFNATTAQVTKIADNIYDCAMVSGKATLLIITPTGFTYGGTTRTQNYIVDGIYNGSYGRITKCVVGYSRGVIGLRNYNMPDLSAGDTTIHRKPVDG